MTDEAPLGPLDSLFLQLEADGMPMHMASIAIFEGPPLRDPKDQLRLRELQGLVAGRLSLVPKLRQRPQPGALPEAPPVWTDDPRFDIANHVVQRRLNSPGAQSDLWELCGHVLAEPLNPDRPLWELIFVDGLEDGRVALIEKLHHSMADGIAAAELATVLLDVSPESGVADDIVSWQGSDPTPLWRGAFRDLRRLAEVPLHCAAWGAQSVLHPIRRSRSLIAEVTALTSVLQGGLIAPHSTLNGELGARREVHVVHLDLNEIRHVAHEHGATVNDMILTLVCCGLRLLMEKDGELLDPCATVQALVPVGLDAGPDRALGNRVSALLARLPVGRDDPVAMLGIIARGSKAHKLQHQELAGDGILRLLEPVPQSIVGLAAKAMRYQPFFNLIVTNVPGPNFPLYVLGAKMIEAFPIVPLIGNQGIGVAALSYLDQINLGVLSDPALCPDIDLFCDGARSGLAVLLDRPTGSEGTMPRPTLRGDSGSAPAS